MEAVITLIGMVITTGAFFLIYLLLRRQAKKNAQGKTIWPAVNCAYSPSMTLVPDERDRKKKLRR